MSQADCFKLFVLRLSLDGEQRSPETLSRQGIIYAPASILNVNLAKVRAEAVCAPASFRAAFFDFAVPALPEIMAPAWLIFLPGGEVAPAIKLASGLLKSARLRYFAARSSATQIAAASLTSFLSPSLYGVT